MDDQVEKYLQEVIKKELEYDIEALKLKEDGPLIKAKGMIRIRRMALEEMYRRTFEKEGAMDFASAVFALERGHKVKRKHWGGYWCLEDGELIMHCRDGRVLNLRESEDMVYTLRNMSCNDWEIVKDW